MNICFFALEHHSLGSGGGIASYLDALVPELASSGHEVHIIVKGRSRKTTRLKDGSHLHEFKAGNLHWYLSKLPFLGKIVSLPIREIEWSWGFYRRFRELKAEYRFTLIESSEIGNLATALFERSVPLVIRLHGSTYSFEKATKGKASVGARLDRVLQRIPFRRAKGISAPSELSKRMFERELGKSFPVKVIPNPVAAVSSPELGGPEGRGPQTIFYAGRIADVKGIWPLLKAFADVVKKKPDVRLVMAGAAHVSIASEEINEFLAERALSGKVEMPGHVARDKIEAYYSMCDVYVAPSYYETFCFSAVEAMLHGKPVVASSETSLEEIVENGKTGLLVPPGNSEALAEAILKLLADDELARRMGDAGKKKAINQYQVRVVAGATLHFYRNVIQNNYPPKDR